jgi:hypothetical protein
MTMQATIEAADLNREIADFMGIYDQRPLHRNLGGMRFNHSFATWFILKTLKPRFVIESGVWQGHSTWLIERACDAKLYCLDINFSHLIFRSRKATYIQKDFAECSWPDVDPAATVCFFDDHQNAYARLKDLRWAGFSRAIFEDNFPCGEGDCYTLRHMLDGFGHEEIQMSKNYFGDAQTQQHRRFLENVLRSVGPRQQVIARANTEDRQLFARNCKEYFEFPPVALNARSDWGPAYEGAYKARAPIYSQDALPQALRALVAKDPAEFGYSYIAYVELNEA